MTDNYVNTTKRNSPHPVCFTLTELLNLVLVLAEIYFIGLLIWSFIWIINGMSFSHAERMRDECLKPPYSLQQPGNHPQIRKLANSIVHFWKHACTSQQLAQSKDRLQPRNKELESDICENSFKLNRLLTGLIWDRSLKT